MTTNIQVIQRWEHYAENAFDVMRAVKRKWRDPNKLQRPILRLFYCDISSAGYCVNNLHLISENAMNNLLYGTTKKERKIVRDHYLSPQFLSRFIYDNQSVYLEDFEEFKKIFYLACGIIIVTQDENDELAKFTKSDEKKDLFEILVPTDKKYDEIGVKLYQYEGTQKWKNRTYIPVSNSILNVPTNILEYEKQYLRKRGDA